VKKKHKRGKKWIKVILAIVGILVLAEIFALIWLANSVGQYKKFWEKKAQESGEITYLALGDSAAQGIGASSPTRGYVGLIADKLAERTNKPVKVVNISKTGAKMNDYLTEQAPMIEGRKADIVTIEIGANDIAVFNADDFRSNFKKVLATLPDSAYVSNMPLFNSRPGSTDNAKIASKIIEEELENYPKLVFVDLQKQTSDHQSIFGFAPDLFHPNNLSYKNWADAFWLKIEKNYEETQTQN
jgi:acyl-CoA thioesterase I